MHIRPTRESDTVDVLSIHDRAFGREEIITLVRDLLSDPTAKPMLSLLAVDDDKAVGHILFTCAHLDNPDITNEMSILAPLAVVPEAQGHGVGGQLIQDGLRLLKESHVDLVFVLGHPTYYPRYGFEPSGRLGLHAPYPIPEKDADAWMVQALRPDVIGSVHGTVKCAASLDKPEHWRE